MHEHEQNLLGTDHIIVWDMIGYELGISSGMDRVVAIMRGIIVFLSFFDVLLTKDLLINLNKL